MTGPADRLAALGLTLPPVTAPDLAAPDLAGKDKA